MKKNSWIALIGAALLSSSCGKQIPSEVIPPAQMENILYDYHLSLGISTQLNTTEEYKKQAYKNYIFKKHHITEAQFDSSMVWYTRNSYELSNIYQKLDKRFNTEKTKLNAMLQERDISIATQAGDTIDLWNFYPVYWLKDTPLSNKVSFSLKADSNYWAKDAFLWKADVTFLTEGKVTMGFDIRFKNDSVVGKTCTFTQSGPHSVYVQSDSLFDIKDVNGFIQVYKDSIHQQPNVIISNVSLTKYHRTEEALDTTTQPEETTPKKEKEQKEIILTEKPKKKEARPSSRLRKSPDKQ